MTLDRSWWLDYFVIYCATLLQYLWLPFVNDTGGDTVTLTGAASSLIEIVLFATLWTIGKRYFKNSTYHHISLTIAIFATDILFYLIERILSNTHIEPLWVWIPACAILVSLLFVAMNTLLTKIHHKFEHRSTLLSTSFTIRTKEWLTAFASVCIAALSTTCVLLVVLFTLFLTDPTLYDETVPSVYLMFPLTLIIPILLALPVFVSLISTYGSTYILNTEPQKIVRLAVVSFEICMVSFIPLFVLVAWIPSASTRFIVSLILCITSLMVGNHAYKNRHLHWIKRVAKTCVWILLVAEFIVISLLLLQPLSNSNQASPEDCDSFATDKAHLAMNAAAQGMATSSYNYDSYYQTYLTMCKKRAEAPQDFY